MKQTYLVALALIAGCSSKSKSKSEGEGEAKGGGAATFTLQAPSAGEPRPSVKVSAKVPAGWKTTVGDDGSPEFELPSGTSFMKPTLVFVQPGGDDDAGRMKSTIRMQYDDAALAAAKREDLAGGRVWIEQVQDNGHVHARLFVPAPAQQGVVMCVAMLKPELVKQLPEIRGMCESVTVGG